MRDVCVHDLWRYCRPVGSGIRCSDGAWPGYLTSPDEALTLLIAGHLLEEEFSTHVFQQPLVESENIGKPAVRDASVTLEHCPHLWEQRMEPALDLGPARCAWLGGCWVTRP